MPPLEEDEANARGYMGHDRFQVKGAYLVRRFPVYREGDANARPSGGERRIAYELVQGEASWQLRPVSSSEDKN